MNLMFWKKKPGTGRGAKDAQGNSSVNRRETLDFMVTNQDATASNPGSPGQEAPVEAGLAARMKSIFTSFTQHFRKAPEFHAGEDYASEARDSSKPAPDDVSTIKPDAKSSPADSGLIERVKPELIAFVSNYKKSLIFALLFLLLAVIGYATWNAIFPPSVTEPARRGTDEALVHEPPPPIKSPHAVSPQSEQPQTAVEVLKKSEETQELAEAPKKETSEPIQTEADVLKKKSEEVQARAEAPKKAGAEQPQAEVKALIETSKEAQARAEALKKKSEEAQAQAEALKKKNEEALVQAEALKKESEAAQARAEELRKKEEEKARADALKKSSRQTGRSATPGEMTVGNDDPKAAAKSLKEAIEAMNADSDASSRGQPNKRSPVRPPQP